MLTGLYFNIKVLANYCPSCFLKVCPLAAHSLAEGAAILS